MVVHRTTASVFLIVLRLFWLSMVHGQSKSKLLTLNRDGPPLIQVNRSYKGSHFRIDTGSPLCMFVCWVCFVSLFVCLFPRSISQVYMLEISQRKEYGMIFWFNDNFIVSFNFYYAWFHDTYTYVLFVSN